MSGRLNNSHEDQGEFKKNHIHVQFFPIAQIPANPSSPRVAILRRRDNLVSFIFILMKIMRRIGVLYFTNFVF